MSGLLLRMFLIALIIYFLAGVIWGGYARITAQYYWMWP